MPVTQSQRRHPVRAAVDIGGTFTDVVVFDETENSLVLAKTLSTPESLERGVLAGLQKSRARLSDSSILIHGSTVVINSVIERRGAKTAFVTTRGFRDVYEIGRINRPDSFNPHFRRHRPLVSRADIFEVDERMLANGAERRPLDQAQAREIAQIIKDEGFEAVGVLFLHSYRFPGHEVTMGQILHEADPAVYVSLSHQLSREYREYERTSTTAANAYVGPVVSRYLTELEARLGREGFAGALMIMQSNGGISDVQTARRQPIQMLESGPAGGVVGTMAICEALGLESAISFDMGGTTAKACVIRRGEPDLSPDYFIGGYNEGLAIRIPVLDIVEVGTGGGSIAWIEEGGALHVGPRSAGAEPGPACYGRGGTEPTITDANVLLGRVSPDAFLDGEMHLDVDAAKRAIRSKSELLGVDDVRTAAGMLEVATSAMANAVRRVTLERGLDPRDFTLVAYGGGGALHGAAVARELSIGTVIVPQAPGHFSAMGMLMADLRRDYVQTVFVKLNKVSIEELTTEFEKLETTGRDELRKAGVASDRIIFEWACDMRYVGQEHAVTVRIPRITEEAIVGHGDIKKLFDEAHEQRFSHSAPEEPADIVSLRVSVIGRLTKPSFPEIAKGTKKPPLRAQKGSREINFGYLGFLDCEVWDRTSLLAGNVIEGPAVIEEGASTTVLDPGDTAKVDSYGYLVLTLAS
jgi:N-methylhydantoinase A